MLQRLVNWVTRTFRLPKQSDTLQPSKRRQAKLNQRSDPTLFTINRDEMTAEESSEVPRLLAEHAEMAFFTGAVKHAYDLSTVETAEICPRCGAPTAQQYANWVYATDKTPRAMAAPAGYFCTKCSIVIVDQTMVAKSVSRGYKFVQVIGLTDERNQGFQGFQTWNGEKPIYLFDENGNPSGLATMGELSPEERRIVKTQRASSRRKRMKVKRKR